MDYYTTLRRETVKSARFDPLIFLYAHPGMKARSTATFSLLT